MEPKLRFLFVTLDGGGNLPPMFGLARRLQDRGHQVRFLTEPCLSEVVEKAGFAFSPFKKYFTRQDRQEDLIRDYDAPAHKDPSPERIMFGPARVVAAEVNRVLQEHQTDFLAADMLLPAALIPAEARRIPNALVFHFPEFLPGANRPPGVFGVLPGKGFLGRLRDRLLTGLFHKQLNQFLPAVNEARADYNLPPLHRTTDLIHRATLRPILTARRFDFPLEPAPEHIRYIGPVLDLPDWARGASPPAFHHDKGNPLITVALSSTFQNQMPVLRNIADAFRGMPVKGVITLGHALQSQQLEVPENVQVLPTASHDHLFERSDAVITHAGHGTLMRAFSYALPVLCLPMGRDQNDNAAKVKAHGLGIKLKPKANPKRIRQSLCQLLEHASYRDQAKHMQQALRGYSEVQEIFLREVETLASKQEAPATPQE